jgi:hypothetical protein
MFQTEATVISRLTNSLFQDMLQKHSENQLRDVDDERHLQDESLQDVSSHHQ